MSIQRRNDRHRRWSGRSPAGQAPQPAAESEASPVGNRWFDFVLKFAVIALAVLWIYSPVCNSTGPLYLPGMNPVYPVDWLWDDDQLLTANLTVQHRVSPDPAVPPDHLGTLAKLWFNPDGADYFPLSYTALWAQWPFFRMDPQTGGPVRPGLVPTPNGPAIASNLAVAWPTGYHVTTVLLHLLGALSLWRLFSVMKLPGAWLGALLFAVHPVCVESVAWVSELKNTLSLPLFLWACIHYIRFDDMIEAGAGHDEPRAVRQYLLAIVFFLLAMFAKTSVVAAPVAILLYAWWKRNAVAVRDLVYSAPFFLISIVLGIITIYYQHGRAIGEERIPVGGFDSRLASSGLSILWYMKILVWPVHLLPIYTKWEVDPPRLWQFLPWPVIAGVGWWFWKNRATWGRHALFVFGFFLLMVAPVLGFITISYMRITWAADHFIYLPMIGIIGFVAAGVAQWYERTSEFERPLIVAGTTVVIAVLTVLAFNYAGCWVHEDALWTHTLTYNENAWQAHNRLGAKKFSRGHVENMEPATRIQNLGAFHHFTRSTALRPDLGETHNNLGTAYSAKAQAAAQRGDKATADQFMKLGVEQFAEACRVTPNVPAIHVNLANALATSGRFDEAAAKFRELLAREPGNPMLRLNVANALASAGKFDEAAGMFQELLAREPNNPGLHNNFGVVLYRGGKKEEAIAQFRRALEIAPGLKDAQESLAIALGEKPDPSAPKPQEPPTAERPQPPAGQPAPLPPLNLQPPQSPTLGPAIR